MTTRVSTNCKVFIGPVAASTVDTLGEFQALSYTEIGQILNIGEFGDAANAITAAYLDSGRVEKYKGLRDAGTLPLQFGYDPANTGQDALIAAEQQPDNYAFKVTLDDEGSGSPQHPTTFYFRGQVMSRRVGIGGADSVVTLSSDVAVNSAIITDEAV